MNYYIKLIRPHQYIKNGFVFAGILFAKIWTIQSILDSIFIFIAFCMISSSVYILNDIIDIEQDRKHPKKCKRPLASGDISTLSAKILLVCLLIGACLMSWSVHLNALICIVIYFALNIFYSLKLKKIVILDIFTISMGFMCRILAGTYGLDIVPSHWLLLCGLMVTLFLGFSKRFSEMLVAESISQQQKIDTTREVLSHYNTRMLEQFMNISAACSLMCYGLYTVSSHIVSQDNHKNLIYSLPIVAYGIFRYLYLVYARGGGGDTSLDIITDKHMLATMLIWVMVIFWLLS